jgi:hypothetical protein
VADTRKSPKVREFRLFELERIAAVGAGRIPNHLLEDKELAAHLPVFFRTLSGQKPSREELEKLLEIIKGTRRP